jgi:hypothetical protein
MAIDLLAERVISFKEASELLPPLRGNKKVHVSTLYLWSQRGCKGVRLEVARVGASPVTSREALSRFVQALTSGRAGPPSHPPPTAGGRSPARRRRESRRAAKQLDDMGA